MTKHAEILHYLKGVPCATIDEIYNNVSFGYYCNANKHLGLFILVSNENLIRSSTVALAGNVRFAAWRRWACRMLKFSRMFLPTFAKPVLYEGGTSRTTLSSKHVKRKRKNERGK